MLDLATRLALRAAGDVEPNPMVGAVVVHGGGGGVILGMGHHRRLGGAHAEREALDACRRAGADVRGATMYVTLEPCAGRGRQPPCTEALIGAGIARVVTARADPHAVKGGGAEVLRRAGIEVEFSGESSGAKRLSDPFVKRVRTGLPWVIAKWAQTPEGGTRAGADGSRWISGDTARRRVHRLRGRVDAIITGIGTVLVDDPRLTARGLGRVRRVARRVVVDAGLRTPIESALVRTCREAPVTVACLAGAGADRREAMRQAGVEVLDVPGYGGRVELAALLHTLAKRHGATNVMVEAGEGLLSSFFDEGLVDEAIVHVGLAPDDRLRGRLGDRVAEFERCVVRRAGRDVEHVLRRRDRSEPAPPDHPARA
jgi:diaminohydroxyphosphoribosylaminopyrimidine deaminase/5-amino-6-(5-phosphoribosylamino)uracil reductase